MTTTTAEELAARLESGWCPIESPADMERAAAELRRLAAVEAERDALRAALNLAHAWFAHEEPGEGPHSSEVLAAIDAAMKGTT